jgi:hypothetical protein
MLYSVWDANSRMCDSMVMERSYVQRLKQEVKLGVVLKEQVRTFEKFWFSLFPCCWGRFFFLEYIKAELDLFGLEIFIHDPNALYFI